MLAILNRLIRNPYTDVYEKMNEYELSSWKMVFEEAIALGGSSREMVLRLRAIKQALENVRGDKIDRAA
jgi:hypothetical protein